MTADQDWQRLDKWLWCARFLKARSACAALIEAGLVRLNRQPTDKPHTRLRVGDVLTIPLARDVRVIRVRALARRRGPAAEARQLYDDLAGLADPCAPAESPAYAAHENESLT